jgi:hypothetical protein
VTAVAIEIRRLSIGDLGEIEEIEQRAYKTPWSRSMFASELAKGTSICLGAFEGDRLVGYVVNSRYVDACSSSRAATTTAATRSKSGSRTGGRSTSTSGSASSATASGAGTTRTTARTP